MKKYNFKFTGRQTGAIGINYKISDTYQCEDIHEALSLLWTDYEHVSGLLIKENGKDIEQPKVIKWVKVRSHSERKRQSDGATYLYTRSDSPINQ